MSRDHWQPEDGRKATASVEYVHIPYTVYRVTVHGVQPDVRARQTVIWNRSNGSGSENSNARRRRTRIRPPIAAHRIVLVLARLPYVLLSVCSPPVSDYGLGANAPFSSCKRRRRTTVTTVPVTPA